MRFGTREERGRRCGDAYQTLSSFRLLQLCAIARMLGSVSWRQCLTREGSDAREIRNAGKRGRRRGDAYATSSFSRLLQLFAIAMMLGSVSLSQPLTREGSDAREIRNAGKGGRRCGDAYPTLSFSRPLQLSAIAMMLGSVSSGQTLTREGSDAREIRSAGGGLGAAATRTRR